ncbi:MAG TPA: protein kinase [Bryobacteraceae bacterium]|nr:protein kinase [Bryobacteraceae bacterium]
MTPEAWQRVRTILERALDLDPEQRPGYLSQACAGDAALFAEVESLLAADLQAGKDFLSGMAVDAAGLKAEDDTAAPPARIGPYQLLEEIGRGGMGVVYRAARADDQYRMQVAIKIVRSGFGDELNNQRFKAERQILANLDHPNIARLLDGGAMDGRPYFVMEEVQGQPIDQYCDVHSLTLRERLELFRTVCSAVAYAHQRLVIHRDLKPGNILVTDDGQPKLLDFGIAKMLDPKERAETGDPTVTILRLMTPDYASPEQTRGDAITTASDVYSLGVVLYGLLTGRRPYRTTGRMPHEISQAILELQPERPSVSMDRRDALDAAAIGRARRASPEKLRRQLRGDLDNILLKALRKEPERRYASVEQLSEDIRRHLAGLPVIAQPDTLAYRSGKFVRRHKAAVIAAAMVVLALLGGMLATMHQASIARAERARAEQRFSDVRQLANSMLFEVHDAIENLPGSTPARKILVDRALEYLDKLAKEAKGDPSLQRELAAAYEKVGDVQGGYRTANLGDTAGFIASYRKALAIRQAALQADPSNVQAQRELQHTYGRLSDALTAIGDYAGSIEQLRQLLPIAERLSAADPKNLVDRRNLAAGYLDYAWKSSRGGDWKAGLAECRKAVGMLENLAAADPADKRTQRILALAYGRLGELLSTYAHQHSESLSMHQKALSVEQALLASDPHNTDLRRIRAWDIVRTGEEMGALNDSAGALRKYASALDEFRDLSRADPNNAQFHLDVAEALTRIGAAYLEAGNAGSALTELQNSLSEIALVSRPGDPNAEALAVKAIDQFRIAKAHQQFASDKRRPASQRTEAWRQAETWFERSLPGLEEARRRGALEAVDSQMVDQARTELARCRQQLNRAVSNQP